MTEAFIVVSTAEEAVDRLAALHERATTALSQALKRYLKDRVEPSAEERALFRYPELRLTNTIHGEIPTLTRAYAKVQLPGTYSITVTHPASFRNYLLEQLVPLMRDFTVEVEVGVSQQNIPYPYVVEQGDELAGSGVTAAALARVFPSTDLSAATDGIADGLYDWENTDPLPLALFDAARVDFSLRRLVHYTGSDYKICGHKKAALRSDPKRGFFTAVLLVNSVSQAFGHNELDNFFGCDFDGCASRRVTASTGRTLGHFQFANTWQSDFAAIFQLISNDLSQLVQSVTRGSFRRVDGFSDISDQLVFSNSH